jgi:uncharacterized RDD family membrane protein YckC
MSPSYPAALPGYPAAAPSYPAPPGYGYTPAGYPPMASGYRFVAPPPVVAVGGAPLAEAWERLVAYLVDSVIQLAAMVIPIAVVIVVMWHEITRAVDGIDNQPAAFGQTSSFNVHFGHLFVVELIAIAILVPLGMLISYLHHVTYMHRTGQTVGKRAMRIRAVRATDGAPISLRGARKRWLVGGLAYSFAPYFQYADTLWLLWDTPYRQCLHDKCAETVVVKVSRE